MLTGVGDRHPQNILVSVPTGALVPIDFGYSFGTATQVRDRALEHCCAGSTHMPGCATRTGLYPYELPSSTGTGWRALFCRTGQTTSHANALRSAICAGAAMLDFPLPRTGAGRSKSRLPSGLPQGDS